MGASDETISANDGSFVACAGNSGAGDEIIDAGDEVSGVRDRNTGAGDIKMVAVFLKFI